MKNYHSNNTQLYVTKDIHSEAYFARTRAGKFARFIRLNNKWVVWFYPYKYIRYFNSLTEMISVIDFMYKKYWIENYGEGK